MDSKVIVTAALTGAVTRRGEGRGATPYVPITPDEVAEEAKRAYDAGASMVHIHSRDPQTGESFKGGQGKENLECYREMFEKIRAKCPIIINITTGGGPGQTLDERLEPVEVLKPDIASYTSGSISYGMYSKTQQKFIYDLVVPTSFEVMKKFADAFRRSNTKPEFEIYCQSMLNNIKIIEDAFIKPLQLQFVMGMPGQVTPATPQNLVRLVDSAKEMFDSFTWSVCVVGLVQWPIITMAAILGADCIRAGMEDNIYLEPGVLAESNGELVEKAVNLARGVGREIATVEEARKILQLH